MADLFNATEFNSVKERQRLERLQARLVVLGFDRTAIDEEEGVVSIQCSQCCACDIMGVPCHETGCRNEIGECCECGCPVPKRQRYCDECWNEQFGEMEELESPEEEDDEED